MKTVDAPKARTTRTRHDLQLEQLPQWSDRASAGNLNVKQTGTVVRPPVVCQSRCQIVYNDRRLSGTPGAVQSAHQKKKDDNNRPSTTPILPLTSLNCRFKFMFAEARANGSRRLIGLKEARLIVSLRSPPRCDVIAGYIRHCTDDLRGQPS